MTPAPCSCLHVVDRSTAVPSNTLELSGELSVGDVIEVNGAEDTVWLACESFGWRAIPAPTNTSGPALCPQTVYRRLAALRGTP